MRKIFIITLTAVSFISMAMIAEAGLLKKGKTPPSGQSIYKKSGAADMTKKPAAATATRPAAYGTAAMNKLESMNKEVPARRY